jgi:polyphosphate kinase 2 (PPK2 family)
MDARQYQIVPIAAPTEEERAQPYLWRFWRHIPARGEWAIFDRSWYGRVLVERMEKLVAPDEWQRAYRDIVDFERNLADDGTVIIKFFLHISKKEQGRRFNKLLKDELNAWRVAPEDLRNHKRYDQWLRVYEEMFEQTETEWGPWTIVEATDRRHTHARVYQTVIETLEKRLGIVPPPAQASGGNGARAGVPAADTVEAVGL